MDVDFAGGNMGGRPLGGASSTGDSVPLDGGGDTHAAIFRENAKILQKFWVQISFWVPASDFRKTQLGNLLDGKPAFQEERRRGSVWLSQADV